MSSTKVSNLQKYKQIFTDKNILKRIIFTIIALAVFRLAVFVPVPFVDVSILEKMFLGTSENGFVGFLNAMNGGAFQQFSIVALGISPYITASIVIQLLQMDIVPFIAEWGKEGEIGKQKINQLTRYSALVLSFIQALAISIGLNTSFGGAFIGNDPFLYIYVALIITAGTAFLLWLADQITMKGIGNGTSMIIVAGILSTFPVMMRELWDFYMGIPSVPFTNYLIFGGIILLFLAIIVGVIFMHQCVRKIPLQYANRPSSASMYGNQDTHLPIKLNSAGVIPVIFAVTLLQLPMLLLQFDFIQDKPNLYSWLNDIFNYQRPLGFILYIGLIFLFTFVYSFMQVNPEKIADNFQKQGTYIPGIRPGIDTENHIFRVLARVTLVGAVYLSLIAALPIIIITFTNVPASVQIGGTSLLIVVGVAIETTKQLEGMTMKKQYKGFIQN